MARSTVKLLLVDPNDRLLLIHGKDPTTAAEYWYPVGGGIEPGESLHDAAQREAHEETGLRVLPAGNPVWRRDCTYRFDGHVLDVHEEWLLHRIETFEPQPAQLTDFEARSILGFSWWSAPELVETRDTVFPPRLGVLLTALLRDGAPVSPIDISRPGD